MVKSPFFIKFCEPAIINLIKNTIIDNLTENISEFSTSYLNYLSKYLEINKFFVLKLINQIENQIKLLFLYFSLFQSYREFIVFGRFIFINESYFNHIPQ